MEHLQEYWPQYLASNTIAVVVMLLAWNKPTAARIMLGLIFLAAILLTGTLCVSHAKYFQPYFGQLNPVLIVVIAGISGFACLAFLQSCGWFEIFIGEKCVQGIAVSAIIAVSFGVVVIVVDSITSFPEDTNVPMPYALLFYPAIAYVVEIVFHAIPLAILVGVAELAVFRTSRSHDSVDSQDSVALADRKATIIWLFIIVVALLEPVFHMSVALSSQSFSGLDIFVGFHVFVINLIQLMIFKRYDFVSMLSLRLFYYFIWNIAWGHLRIELLF